MDSHRCINLRSHVVFLLLIISIAAHRFPLSLSSSVAFASGEKVKLTLYYEALCPACADFIVNNLYKIFDNGLISIVDLKLSPYGNAKITSNGTIVCQHGEWECLLNTIEACSIHAWPVVSDHFPFIKCVEKLNDEERYTEWNTCFKKLELDPKPVIDCYTSGIGHELELQYADEITALKPPHDYVPWVVVDGQPLYEDFPDFISFICKAYKGSNMPRACVGISRPITAPTETVKSVNHVCYKGKDRVKSKSTLSEFISATIASWMILYLTHSLTPLLKKMKLSFAVLLLLVLLLTSAFAISPVPSPPSSFVCDKKCELRCSRSGWRDRCLKYCRICCGKCKGCVPSGPYADKAQCPCYRDMKNPKGKDKCP